MKLKTIAKLQKEAIKDFKLNILPIEEVIKFWVKYSYQHGVIDELERELKK